MRPVQCTSFEPPSEVLISFGRDIVFHVNLEMQFSWFCWMFWVSPTLEPIGRADEEVFNQNQIYHYYACHVLGALKRKINPNFNATNERQAFSSYVPHVCSFPTTHFKCLFGTLRHLSGLFKTTSCQPVRSPQRAFCLKGLVSMKFEGSTPHPSILWRAYRFSFQATSNIWARYTEIVSYCGFTV